ncbi:hypothetical protein Poly24_29550 [Rosistilla carotiformis]|uniref:DUF5666 domain-containing protein n=1 Tax=Rosistilla carotiformis TaxID=2528017 RepID=A0A518JUL5_9BACT|nr:hypothetical protein [Rosistilla carotiformis]QDV69240.1 hypothetical protein Poly24_29550 [Rosistilla carotiformis]
MKMQQTTKRRRWVLALAIGTFTPFAVAPQVRAADQEFGDNTPYYEDDAWYDVSEWFDGNDYNPTDEAIGRWDDETYDAADARTSSDQDNDIDWSTNSHGYYDDQFADNDWFYDYYDSGYQDASDYDRDGYFDYTAAYFDHDNDGVYDAFAEYSDTDSDGVYETYNYVGFTKSDADNAAKQDRQSRNKAQDEQKSKRSKVVKRSGEVKAAKEVKTPQGTNIVVVLKDSKKGENVIVDLGPADQIDKMPRLGQDLQAEGAPMTVGEKRFLIACKLTTDGKERSIDRSGRKFSGTVSDIKTVDVRGKTHQLAKLKTDGDKKLLVDMGPKDDLPFDVKKDSKLTVSGPAVRVKERLMLIARNVTVDGKEHSIQRSVAKK